MPMDWNRPVSEAARELCGKTFVHVDADRSVYRGIVYETCGYAAKEGKKRELFFEAPGTVILWPYRFGKITNVAAHEYNGSGLVEIRSVLADGEEIGPLKFTKEFHLDGKNSYRIRKAEGSGIYVAETPDLEGLQPVSILDEQPHPGHRIAHWRLRKKD